jgi:hypothetical protein
MNSSSPYRTSLPVVQEDIRDAENDWTDSEGRQDALQDSLDICLSHLENLQFSDSSSSDSTTLAKTASSSTTSAVSPVKLSCGHKIFTSEEKEIEKSTRGREMMPRRCPAELFLNFDQAKTSLTDSISVIYT